MAGITSTESLDLHPDLRAPDLVPKMPQKVVLPDNLVAELWVSTVI